MRVDSGIPGVGPIEVSGEYTSPVLNEKFQTYINILTRVLAKKPEERTEQDYLDLQQALDGLQALLKDKDENAPGGTRYVTEDMVKVIRTLFQQFETVGIQPGAKLDPQVGLQRIKNLDITLIVNTIKQAAGAGETAQALLLLICTQVAKDFAAEIKKLNDALKINTDVAAILRRLQQLRNQCVQTGDGNIMPQPTLSAYISKYGPKDGPVRFEADTQLRNAQIAAANDDKLPIPPKIVITEKSATELKQILADLKAQLQRLKDAGINPSIDGKEGNLADQVQGLVNGLEKDFSAAGGNLGVFAYKYMMDGKDQIGGEAGSRSDALSNAITASQTLNETQRDLLNQTWFRFESVMKALTDAMRTLSENVVKFGRGISKG